MSKKLGGMLAAMAATMGLVAGCGGAGNNGGDTTCEAFLEMSGSDQKAVVKKFMEDEGRDMSGLSVNITLGSAKLFCNTVGSPDSKIREIDG